jgi:hypothetical protein
VLELTLPVADAAALRALFDSQLTLGRAFVRGEGVADGVEALTACELVIEQGGRTHRLAAEVVFVKAEGVGCGVGLQLRALDAEARAALRTFVDEAVDEAVELPEAPQELTEDDIDDSDAEAGRPAALNVQERVRTLSMVEQQKLAATGTLTERIALERMFGPNVWEILLRNQRITIPEVARIARKGTLPRPLVEIIAASNAWIAAGDVQRALLGNPRSSAAVVARVLQMLSRQELFLVPQQTAYPQTVRQAARKMLART